MNKLFTCCKCLKINEPARMKKKTIYICHSCSPVEKISKRDIFEKANDIECRLIDSGYENKKIKNIRLLFGDRKIVKFGYEIISSVLREDKLEIFNEILRDANEWDLVCHE